MNRPKLLWSIPLPAGSIALLILAYFALSASGCPIPVFQYALEHWPSDDYLLEVFLPAKLSAAEDAAWKKLQSVTQGSHKAINLRLRLREGANPAAPAGRAWLELQYPTRARSKPLIWQGILSPENVERILDSPFRQRLAKALVGRTSVVWIFLNSGHRQNDAQAERLVRENLAHLASAIVIPEQAEWGGELLDLDYEVKFELLSLNRDDSREEIFLAQLLGSEPDLRGDFADQPLLFPVFGRGLLLYALAANGINRWTLEKAVGFLTGSCSCQVKAANPGLDLLLQMDWARLVQIKTVPSVGGTLAPADLLQAGSAAE